MALSSDFAHASQRDKDDLLLKASWKNDLDGVKTALTAGASVKATEQDGATALHYAARNDNAEMVRLLIHASADVNALNNDCRTPLYYAMRARTTAEILLENGASPNARTMQGWMPLHEAVECKNLEMAKLLVDYGADPFIPCLTNETADDIATKRGYREFSEVFATVPKAPGAKPAKRVKQLDLF
ncbi:MAG: ankyrin repeat domain-containing protein [Alphaproteobacteria bacterium]